MNLGELEAFDPGARAGSRERRFCCPLEGCQGKRVDAAHRSLSVNVETGAYRCHRCGEAGLLDDFRGDRERPARGRKPRRVRPAAPPSPPPASEEDRATFAARVAGATSLDGTPGAAYLRGRGLDPEGAHRAGARFATDFGGRPAILFPLRDRDGRLVAVHARYVGEGTPKCRTVKQNPNAPHGGVFATPGALDAPQATIVEAPLDALSLALCGCPALATVGTACPGWLPRLLALRRAFVGHDADEAGDVAASRVADELRAFGAVVERLRPLGEKDWNDLLKRHGPTVMRMELMTVGLVEDPFA